MPRPRKTAKRTYKRRTYKKRYYKRRFYRRYKPIKKPEIRICESMFIFNQQSQNGQLRHLTEISDDGVSKPQANQVKYKLNGQDLEGRKIRLKYLYIKGYLQVDNTNNMDDFNAKFYVFRKKKNLDNTALTWTDLLDMPEALVSPGSWDDTQRLDVLYTYNWKNDINGIIKKKVKNLYRRYDNANNIVPFKLRIPLYDCVMSCDTSISNSTYSARIRPSTNDIYYAMISNKALSNTTFLRVKFKLYYTDY